MTIKKPDVVEEPKRRQLDPLLKRPVAFAYALIPDPENTERYFAVRLIDVVAGGLEHLEGSGRSSASSFGVARIIRDMETRQRRRSWRSA